MGRLVEQRGLEYLTDFAGQYDLGYTTFSLSLEFAVTDEGVVLAAKVGHRIRVLAFYLTINISSNRGLVLEETTSGTDLLFFNSRDSSPISLPYSDKGWAQTIVGEGLDLRILDGTGVSVQRGGLVYAYPKD